MNEIHPDRAVEAIARRQHGVFLRQQAFDAGFTDRMIGRRIASAAWLRLDPGLYALGTHPFTWLRQAKAAELSLPGSALSHRAGAVLHEVPGFRSASIDLTVAPGSSSRSRFATVHRRQLFDSVIRHGIRVTTLERVVFDLAPQLSALALRDLVHDLVVRRRTTVAALVGEYERLVPLHPRGLVVVRSLLDQQVEGRVPPANELERVLKAVLDDPRLPRHEPQAPRPWWPQAAQRVDELIPSWRRIVEADGRLWHTREADFERDRARDHLAQRHGYEVTRFTYHQLIDDPEYAIGVLLDIGICRAA
jgi:very-short-patch-repair endonuclease